MSTIFFTTLLQLMLSSRLLQPVIDGKKIIIVVFSNLKKKKSNLKPRICCKKYCECYTSKKNKNNNKSWVSKILLVLI